jgi:hypothetical protein
MRKKPVCGCLVLWVMLNVTTPSEAQQWPDQRQIGRVRLFADFSLEGYQPLVTEIGQLQLDLQEALAVGESTSAVYLFLFQSEQTYRDYLREYFPGTPARRALFIKGRGPGMVFAYLNRDFAVDVRHEVTHALLHSQLPMVPLWLDEGLAEYFEVPPDQRVSKSPHQTPTKWAAWFGRYQQLKELEAMEKVEEMGMAEYRAAWAWVHFMLHDSSESREALIRYLVDIQRHQSPGCLSDRLRQQIPELDQRFLRHFRGW